MVKLLILGGLVLALWAGDQGVKRQGVSGVVVGGVTIACEAGMKFEGDEHDDLIPCQGGKAFIPEGSYRRYEVICATLESGRVYCFRRAVGE